jgi:two-component sensor histidine kinase
MRLTIRAQIVLACLAVMVPLAAAEAYFILVHYRAARPYAVAHARETGQAIAATTAAVLADLRDGALATVAEATRVGGDPRRIQTLLEHSVRPTRPRASVIFIRSGGQVGASVPREIAGSGVNFANQPSFQALRNGGEWQPINLTQSRLRGIPAWGVMAPVRKGGKFLGAVVVALPLTEFDRLISVKMPPGSWSVVDNAGRLVFVNGLAETRWEGRDRAGQELIRRALSGELAVSEQFRSADGVQRLGAGVPIHPFGWVVEVSRPVAEVLARARTESLIEASVYAPALAFAFLVAFFIGNRIGLPLARLTAAADRIAQGECEVRAEPGGPPELARLMASFNAMSASLDRRQKWDEALKAIGRAATSGVSVDDILAAGLEAMMRASGATAGVVRLVDPGTRGLVATVHRNLPSEYLEAAREIPWGAKLAGYVAYSAEPWLIGRLQEQPQVSHLGLLAGRVESLACLPLMAHDRVVGTITLGHQQPEFFGPSDLPALLPAASMLAGAILVEQLRAVASRKAQEKAVVFRELDHRVRNNLASLISLLHLAAEGAQGPAAETLQEMADRVARLADVHNLLTDRGNQPIEARGLVRMMAENVLAALPGNTRIEWSVIAEPVLVPPSHVTPIALILNELLTNCAKHAFPGRASGTVTILVGPEGDHTSLEVRDDGVGLDLARHPAGLGLSIVRTLVTQNLRGSLTLSFPSEGGTRVRIRFPRREEKSTGGAL